jgi:hypothetical protein
VVKKKWQIAMRRVAARTQCYASGARNLRSDPQFRWSNIRLTPGQAGPMPGKLMLKVMPMFAINLSNSSCHRNEA